MRPKVGFSRSVWRYLGPVLEPFWFMKNCDSGSLAVVPTWRRNIDFFSKGISSKVGIDSSGKIYFYGEVIFILCCTVYVHWNKFTQNVFLSTMWGKFENFRIPQSLIPHPNAPRELWFTTPTFDNPALCIWAFLPFSFLPSITVQTLQFAPPARPPEHSSNACIMN